MKHYDFYPIRIAAALAFLGSLPQLNAAEPIEVHWNQVCGVANGRELRLTTTAGDTVAGYCLTMDVDEITITTPGQKVVKVARAELALIEMRHQRGRQFSSLMKNVHGALRYGVESLLTPWAPLGIVALPSTLAWGAIATPFCLFGDLIHQGGGKQEIKLN